MELVIFTFGVALFSVAAFLLAANLLVLVTKALHREDVAARIMRPFEGFVRLLRLSGNGDHRKPRRAH